MPWTSCFLVFVLLFLSMSDFRSNRRSLRDLKRLDYKKMHEGDQSEDSSVSTAGNANELRLSLSESGLENDHALDSDLLLGAVGGARPKVSDRQSTHVSRDSVPDSVCKFIRFQCSGYFHK